MLTISPLKRTTRKRSSVPPSSFGDASKRPKGNHPPIDASAVAGGLSSLLPVDITPPIDASAVSAGGLSSLLPVDITPVRCPQQLSLGSTNEDDLFSCSSSMNDQLFDLLSEDLSPAPLDNQETNTASAIGSTNAPPTSDNQDHAAANAPSIAAQLLRAAEELIRLAKEQAPATVATDSSIDTISTSTRSHQAAHAGLSLASTDDSSCHQAVQQQHVPPLSNLLGHHVQSIYKLMPCQTDKCSYLCLPGYEQCRKCSGLPDEFQDQDSFPSESKAPSIETNAPTLDDNQGTTASAIDANSPPTSDNQDEAAAAKREAAEREQFKLGVAQSQEYRDLMGNPTSQDLIWKVAELLAGKHLCNLDFRNLVRVKDRSLQIHLIPLIVHLLISAIDVGLDEEDTGIGSGFFEAICEVILDEKLPQTNNFVYGRFPKTPKCGYTKYMNSKQLHNVSMIVWASLFVLDLFLYSEVYNQIDLLANLFFNDESLLNLADNDIVGMFAALGYSMVVNTRVIVKEFKSQLYTRGGKEKKFILTLVGRLTASTLAIERAVKGPLYKKLMIALGRHGFLPTLNIDGDKHPELRDFSEVCCSPIAKSGIVLRKYLLTMFDDLTDNIGPLAETMCTSNGAPMAFPLFILAFSFHIRRSSATGISGNELLNSKLAGGFLSVFNPTSMATIENPSFEHFTLVNSDVRETNVTNLCRFVFEDATHQDILGIRKSEGLSRDNLLPFSFNFTQLDDESRVFEILFEIVKRNPKKYFSHPGFMSIAHKWKKLTEVNIMSQHCSEKDISHAHSAAALATPSFAQV